MTTTGAREFHSAGAETSRERRWIRVISCDRRPVGAALAALAVRADGTRGGGISVMQLRDDDLVQHLCTFSREKPLTAEG